MELYNYNKNENLKYHIEKVKKGLLKDSSFQKFILTYMSPYKTGIEENDEVHCELFLNKDSSLDAAIKANINHTNSTQPETNNPLLISIHGFSSKKDRMDNYYYFINKILEKNINCAFINLPLHLYRTPRGEESGERLIYFDDKQTLEFFHQSVVDIMKFIDIILNILPIKSINICGLSLGSMVSLITMANDRRINKGIFLIGGGNWHEIHWNSGLRFILKGNCSEEGQTTREKCREFYSNFPDFLNEFKKISSKKIPLDLKKYPELKKVTTKMCFLCDPLAFAHKINPNNVLMINSKFDFYFPKKSTLQLWEELGKPEIHWLNSLHSSKIITNAKVIKTISDFIFP